MNAGAVGRVPSWSRLNEWERYGCTRKPTTTETDLWCKRAGRYIAFCATWPDWMAAWWTLSRTMHICASITRAKTTACNKLPPYRTYCTLDTTWRTSFSVYLYKIVERWRITVSLVRIVESKRQPKGNTRFNRFLFLFFLIEKHTETKGNKIIKK